MADRTVVYRLKAEVGNFKAQVTNAGASLKELGDKATAADRDGARFRQGLEQLGGTAGKVGLIAAAGLGAAITKAANFDEAMSAVQSATHETTGNMERLRTAALEAGASTAFSATEAAAGIEELAKAGVSTTDILSGGLMGALDLAAAGQIEVAAAAEYTATALNQFSLDGSQASHVADLLAAGAGKAQGEVSDMANALNYAGVPASNLGVSIEETAGAIALLASNGIIGEQAGTSLRGMLASLTSPSKAAATEMEKLGISVFDAEGKFVGFDGVAGQLQSSMSGLTDAERANSLGRIFGNEQLQAANVLYREGEGGVRRMTAAVDDQGYAAETAAMKLDNLKGDLEELGGALETALIGTGDSGQGPLRSLTQGLTSVVNAYNELPGAAKGAAAGIAGVTAAVGGSIFIGSKIVTGIADTREALASLGISGDKASRAMRGVAAAGAGLAALSVGAAGIRAIQDATDRSLPGLEELQGVLLQLAETGNRGKLSAEFDGLGDSLDRIADKSRGEAITDALQTPFEGLFGEAGSLRQAGEQVEALDQALAGLVATAGPEAANKALRELYYSGELTGVQFRNLTDLLPQYNDAMAGVANEATIAEGATSGLGGAMTDAAGRTQEQAQALEKSRAAAAQTAGAFFDLGDSLNDSSVSLGDWIRQMSQQAEALRNFRRNAETAANRGLRQGLIAALQEAGPEGAMRMQQLANATDAEIGRANKAWRNGQREINRYVDATGEVPSNVSTTVKVNDEAARTKLQQIKREAQSVAGDYRINYIVTQTNAYNKRRDPNVPYATGGYTGDGGKYEPAGIVHRGEVVLPQEIVNRDSRFLRSRYGHLPGMASLPGYASGGVVGSKVVSISEARGRKERDEEEKKATRSLKGLRKALDEARSELDGWKSKMADVRSSTTSRFGVDLFGSNANPWEAGGTGRAAVAQTTGDLRDRIKLQRQLAKAGLKGDALAAVLDQGSNDDLRAMLAGGGLKKFQREYMQMVKLQRQAGNEAASAAYGAKRDAAAAEVKRLRRDLAQREKRDNKAADERSKKNSRDTSRGVSKAGSRGAQQRGRVRVA